MKTAQLLNRWSWQEITGVYKIYGIQMQEMKGIAKRLSISLPLEQELVQLSGMHPQRAEIVCRLFLDARRLNTHIKALDREIERRNALIGVMG